MDIDTQCYVKNPDFWTKKGDNLTVIGDYLGRLPSIDLLNPSADDAVLDAGCGAGFIARRLAKKGAKVFGCDRDKNMLDQAVREEVQQPLGIEYALADITSLPYDEGVFTKIACIAVLIHNSPLDCEKFFKEAQRTLKDKGLLVVSIMHPALYQPTSPNRLGQSSWAQYTSLESKSMTESQRFQEVYRDRNGNTFESAVWYHPEKTICDALNRAGLTLQRTQTTYVTPAVLSACHQTGPSGYPAFWQVCAQK